MEQRYKDHFLMQYIKQLGVRDCWDPAELPAPQMGRRRSSLHYISVFQARTWVFSVLFETEHQGIETHKSLGGVSCDLNTAAPGLLAKLQLCYSQFRWGHHHSHPPLSTPCRANSAGVSRSLALRHLLQADNGVSHLRLLLINKFLKYLYRPSLCPKYWLRKDNQWSKWTTDGT